MEIVIASRNLHKIREFRDLLKSLKLDVLSLLQFPDYRAPEETSLTFKENATLKAEHAAKALNRWVIADDSGLIVPALQGEPGVFSRRYAGDDATDADNRQKLLQRMQGMNDDARTAYFECCLALASPLGLKKCVTGRCEGMIASSEKGNHGFGYDSLFIKHDYDKTFGELDENTKNRISHRGKAVEKLAAALESL